MQVLAFFTNDGVPQPALTPTVRIRDISDNSLVVTDAAASEVGDGWYKYDFAAYDGTKEYAIRFDGGAALADSDRYTSGTNDSFVDDITDGVWDEVLTGLTHNITQSAGKYLREIGGKVIHTGTAQGSGTGDNQIQLAVDASALDGAYDPSTIAIVDGLGVGQSRLIFQYDGSTKIATVDRNWKLNPDITSEYIVYANPGREHVNEGLAQGGTINTITLNTLASHYDGNYVRQRVFIRSGQGEDQVRTVIAYDGTTKVAIMDVNWEAIPNTTSAYVMIPARGETKESIANSVWDEELVKHLNDETTGHALMHEAYDNTIFVDPINGTNGFVYPHGIRQHPVKSITDILVLSANYNLSKVHVLGSLTVSGGEDISGYTFISDRSLGNIVTVTNAITNETYFENLTVSGTMNGAVRYTTSVLGTINNFDGGAKNCLITGNLNITGTGANYLTDCDTYVTDATYKQINVGDKLLNIIRCRGNYEIINYTGSAAVTIDLVAGHILIANSCVSGMITVSGLVRLIDNSGAGCMVIDGTLSEAGVANDVWDSELADHKDPGSYGYELATKADIAASSSTDMSAAINGSVVYGTQDSGTYLSTNVRDNTYWVIEEDVSDGLTVELLFNIPDDQRAGVFRVFGRYEGVPSTTHYMELWVYNYEASAWEQLLEIFLPGGNVSDAEYEQNYFERNIDRANNNEVKFRLIHNVTTYIATHHLYLDFAEVTSIDVITAADIADAVLDEDITKHSSANSLGLSIQKTLGLLHENIYIDNPVYDDGNNLISARVRIYSDSGSVGTSSNVIGTYELTAGTDDIAGKFNTWKQVKI